MRPRVGSMRRRTARPVVLLPEPVGPVTRNIPRGRRQMRALKLQVADELRARALTRRTVTRAWIDAEAGWLAVDSASATRAEELVETLRDTLGSLAVQMWDTERSVSASMATWLQRGAPGPFSLEQDLELESSDAQKSTVRYRHHPLDGQDIRGHLEAGKRPTQLGLTWNGRIAFILSEKLHVKRMQFPEMAAEREDGGEIDPVEQFVREVTVRAGELGERLGESSGLTSYHLRALAGAGFVEDAVDHPTRGRERWWRGVGRSAALRPAPPRGAARRRVGVVAGSQTARRSSPTSSASCRPRGGRRIGLASARSGAGSSSSRNLDGCSSSPCTALTSNVRLARLAATISSRRSSASSGAVADTSSASTPDSTSTSAPDGPTDMPNRARSPSSAVRFIPSRSVNMPADGSSCRSDRAMACRPRTACSAGMSAAAALSGASGTSGATVSTPIPSGAL